MSYLKKCLLLILFPLLCFADSFFLLPQELQEKIYDSLDTKDINALYETSKKKKKQSVFDYICFNQNGIEINQEGDFFLHTDKTKKILKESPCSFFTLNTQEKIACIENFFKKKSITTKELQIDFPISEKTQELRLQMEEKKTIEKHFHGTTKVTGFFFCKEKQDLHDAILQENRKKINLLLNQDPDQAKIFAYDQQNIFDDNGLRNFWISPLSLAVKTKKTTLIKKILDVSDLIKESRIHYYNENIYFFSPLFFTFLNNDRFSIFIAEMLLQKDPKGFFFRSINNENLIHASAILANKSALKFFLAANSEGAKDKSKRKNEIPLHYAAREGDANNILNLLMANSKGINEKDHNGNTPMWLAAYFGEFNIVKKFLFINKESTKQRNNDGLTPLHAAALNGHIQIVNTLINADPNGPQQRTNDGSTPLHFAAQNRNTETVNTLINADPNGPQQRDNDGSTPLHFAAQNRNTQIVNTLINADPNGPQQRTNDGLLPIDLAKKYRNTEIVKILLKYNEP